MLFKLSLKNITNSLRDYAVYFFTLIIAVSIFYVFNAVGGQAAMIGAASRGGSSAELLGNSLSTISVFVSIVLAFLIVYASRFLMKRRHKEFALYMMLGMSKRRISATLLVETFLIGLASLGVGLVAGVGLSQLMSALVASLFDADMSAYHFTLSSEAIGKTIMNFSFMYVLVMLLNTHAVIRMKLIDLMQSGKKSERVKMRNPLLCTVVFLLSAAILAFAYNKAQNDFTGGSFGGLFIDIMMGFAGTLLFFWSVSGFFLRITQSMKGYYFRGLNCFTIRQIASKVNTVVFSMSVICVMLFFTISMLSSSLAMRNGMYANMSEHCPADFEASNVQMDFVIRESGVHFDDVVERCRRYGYDVLEPLDDYVHFHSYRDQDVAFYTDGGTTPVNFAGKSPMSTDLGVHLETVVRVSDYNKLMAFYGRDQLSLDGDQFCIVCDYEESVGCFNEVLKGDVTAQVFGHTLKAASHEVRNGFIDLSTMQANFGFTVVPDNVVDETYAAGDYLIGNYNEVAKADLETTEKKVEDAYAMIDGSVAKRETDGDYWFRFYTKEAQLQQTLQSGALMTFVCLYLGMVFLVASGAVLALRGLSDSVDSVMRYDTLRKLGVDKREMNRSLLRQTAFFFALPLLLACFHSIFGIRCMMPLLKATGVQHISESIVWTIVIILAIYGSYFLTTYLGSKRIIEEQQ